MPTSRDPMQYRAGDSDRDRAAEVLREAAGEGRLTLDELDTRLSAVFAAVTYGQLSELTDDLPPSAAVPVVRADDKPLVLAGAGGAVRREGRWRVPSEVLVERKHGSVLLDFSEATVSAEITTVELRVKHCAVTVVLPDGATAEIECVTKFTNVRSNVPAMATTGHPHLRVHGETAHGSLRVRYPRGRRRRAKRRG